MRIDELAFEAAVEWLGADDDRDGLRHGHPGRINDPTLPHVFVEWVGLEHAMASRVSYDASLLGPLTDMEYVRRSMLLAANARSPR